MCVWEIELKIPRNQPSQMATECSPGRKPAVKRFLQLGRAPKGRQMILRWFLWRGISVALFEGSQNFIMCSYPGLTPGLYSAACFAGSVNGSGLRRFKISPLNPVQAHTKLIIERHDLRRAI